VVTSKPSCAVIARLVRAIHPASAWTTRTSRVVTIPGDFELFQIIGTERETGRADRSA